ncbi:MAG: helix-turn-helix domain-containing protein [Prevotellaceae bacterium]|jgi:transcriptional regulator with XRE-family HTH domain|nr:helix-turn-helix domain-containing protein [Prevotellaceae bacterium]
MFDRKKMSKELVLKEIGLKIREMRNVKNFSLVEFSDKLDIEYNNLIRIEKGRTNLTIGTLLKICQALDVNLPTLVDVEAGHFAKGKKMGSSTKNV